MQRQIPLIYRGNTRRCVSKLQGILYNQLHTRSSNFVLPTTNGSANTRPTLSTIKKFSTSTENATNVETDVADAEMNDMEEEEYAEHDPDSGIPCTFIELPKTSKVDATVKPFSLLSFSEDAPLSYDKEQLQRQFGDYLSLGGRVISLHHGYESVIFEELMNQSIFQNLNPDDLTIQLPISTWETLTGQPAIHAPPSNMIFDEEAYAQNQKDKCPHFVPFRPGFAFEHVIHHMALQKDQGVDMQKDCRLTNTVKYDDPNFTPSFLLPTGVEPKKEAFTDITLPAGRYMGDRIRDKILQVTSHLASESVDILVLDEMDMSIPQLHDYRYSVLAEAFLQFELAVIDGLARGYSISSATLGRDLQQGAPYSMYKVLLVANYAAELARMCRGLPTKDPNFHPSQWTIIESIAHDSAHLPSLEDPVYSNAFYTGNIADLPSVMTNNLKDKILAQDIVYAYMRQNKNMAHAYELKEDFLLYAKEYNPLDLEHIIYEKDTNAMEGDSVDMLSTLHLPGTAVRLLRQRRVVHENARKWKVLQSVEASLKAATTDAKVLEAWNTYKESEYLKLFLGSLSVKLPSTSSMSTNEMEVPQLVSMDVYNTELMKSILKTMLDIYPEERIEYIQNNYNEYMKLLTTLQPTCTVPEYDIQKIITNLSVMSSTTTSEPSSLTSLHTNMSTAPVFMNNKRICNMISVSCNVTLFDSAAVRIPQYPPVNPNSKRLVTLQQYVTAHGLLFVINQATKSIINNLPVTFESINKYPTNQLANIRNEASKITKQLQALEHTYPYLAADSGYEGLPPAYALSPATLFTSKVQEMTISSIFDAFVSREFLPATWGALEQIQNIPVFAEYVKQYRVLLDRFVKSQTICMEQTMAPVMTVVEEYIDELCPKLAILPTLQCKLYALALALEADSVQIGDSDSIRPIIDMLEIERRQAQQDAAEANTEDVQYPLLPNCIPTREEALNVYTSFETYYKKDITSRIIHLNSLCIENVHHEQADIEKSDVRYIDLYVPGEQALLNPPIKETIESKLEYAEKASKFLRKHNMYTYTMN